MISGRTEVGKMISDPCDYNLYVEPPLDDHEVANMISKGVFNKSMLRQRVNGNVPISIITIGIHDGHGGSARREYGIYVAHQIAQELLETREEVLLQ